MADEQTQEQTAGEQEQIVTPVNSPFSEESWSESPVKAEETAPANGQQKENISHETKDEEEIIDPNEWVKREFQLDNADVLKQTIDEYKKLKEKPQTDSEIKFADEQSKLIHELIRDGKTKEVRKFLETQERLDELVSAEINKDTAADIIKMGMQLKYKDLSPKEIEYKFNKQFGLPKKPVERDDLTEDENREILEQWQEQVDDIETNKVIEAKLLKPELEKSKSTIVLPEISKKDTTQEVAKPTQEELDAFGKSKVSFLQSAEQSINNFNGFSVAVKDKDVDFTVNYAPSQEEKVIISNKVKEFAESGFDANALLAERWVSEDGKSLNVDKITKDLLRIYADDNVSQKLVTDAANKRLEVYLKEKKQINVNQNNQGDKFSPEHNGKSEQEKMADFFWSQS